jgi:hypothetical protein
MHLSTTRSSPFLAAALVGSALIGSTVSVHAIDCRPEKGEGYPWAWRQIDGKRCWYKGTAGMDKKLLRWADTTNAPPPAQATNVVARAQVMNVPPRKRPTPIPIDDPAEREHLLYSYWPPVPPADVFSDRFEAARGQRR